MLTCKWVRPKLLAFLLGELPAWQLRAVAAHAGRCPGCVRDLDSLRYTVAALTPPEATRAYLAQRLPAPTREQVARLRALLSAARQRPARVVRSLAVACVLLGALFLAPARLAPAQAGTVVWLSGHPECRLSGEPWRHLTSEAAVPRGATLRTGETDVLEVQLGDGSRLRLDFGSQVYMDTRTAARGAIARADLRLERGRVWLLVTPDQTGLRVRTETATAEAVGTVFEVASHARGEGVPARGPVPEAAVTVLGGEVRVSNPHGSVIAGAGTTTAAYPNRAPDPPQRITYLSVVRTQSPWGRTQFEVWTIPALEGDDMVRRLAGRRGWLGVETAGASVTLSGDALPGPGVTVRRVAPHSPAAGAGVVPGDRLVQVGDTPVAGQGDVWRAELRYLPGTSVDLVFLHGQRRAHAEVVLGTSPLSGEMPAEPRLEAANRDLAEGRTAQAQRGYAALMDTEVAAAARHNLGVIAEAAGLLPQAEAYYRQAVEGEPGNARFHFSLALGLARLGNVRRGARELEAALARDPEYPEARFQLGRLLGALDDFDGARLQVEHLQADPRRRAQGLCLAGELAHLRADLHGAAAWYRRAQAADPLSPEALTCLGTVSYELGDLGAARIWCQRALVLEPDSALALNCLGLIRCADGRYPEAIASFLRAEEKHPGYAMTYCNLGLAYSAEGELEKAEEAYRQAIKAAPEGLYPRLGLALALERNGEFGAAKTEYQELLTRDPTCRDAYSRLASLHRKLGELAFARAVEGSARRYGL